MQDLWKTKCQTNICQDEVRCQSEISVNIQRAHTLSAAVHGGVIQLF